jgi:hypothetical protein
LRGERSQGKPVSIPLCAPLEVVSLVSADVFYSTRLATAGFY